MDNGYRGPLRSVAVWVPNMFDDDVAWAQRHVMQYHVDPGERLAQLIIMRMAILPVEEVAALSDSDRGQLGFGSTGR